MNRFINRGTGLILFAIYMAVAFNQEVVIYSYMVNVGQVLSIPLALWAAHYMNKGTR